MVQPGERGFRTFKSAPKHWSASGVMAGGGVEECLRHGSCRSATATAQRFDCGSGVLKRSRSVRAAAGGRHRGAETDERPRMRRNSWSARLKMLLGASWITRAQPREAGAIVRIHHELRTIKLSGAAGDLAREFLLRLRNILEGEADETEQPVEPARGEALTQMHLAILDDGPFAQQRLGAIQ